MPRSLFSLLERVRAKHATGLDPVVAPVRVKKTCQIKKLERVCDSIKTKRALAIASSLVVLTAAIGIETAGAAPTHNNPHIKRHRTGAWHGYGFLPGYRSPDRIEWERARQRGPVYWYGYPRFYRGQWNGGGFGPCWTQTPIGNVWNCGK